MTWARSDAGAEGLVKSTFWVQFWPYRCGTVTSATRLAPNMAAATTAATATVIPARALRTGTAVRPCPGAPPGPRAPPGPGPRAHPHADPAGQRAGRGQRQAQPRRPGGGGGLGY